MRRPRNLRSRAVARDTLPGMLGPAKMLECLGAHPKTPYSWGAVSRKGDVFLRVWNHEVRHDQSCVLVFDPADDDLRDALGRPNQNALEREEHIELNLHHRS